MEKYSIGVLLLGLAVLQGCGSDPSNRSTQISSSASDSICTGCDHVTPADPVLTTEGGYGGITTYGSVTNPMPSQGGACNYGSTAVMNFAAASVNIQPGDGLGLWNQGHICGQCVRVRVGSPTGWKQVVVRLMDSCHDDYCGIDLGGAPALALMGSDPGRYAGAWTLISCDSGLGYPMAVQALW